MLKVIAKTINVCAAIYFTYMVGSAVYEMGKEAGRKEVAEASESNSDFQPEKENSDKYPTYKVVDGVMYRRVK